ncbi:6-phospho-3-hexuloisomerase [Paenibacillus aestuarii]|uniref:6-phospho-3-hexuloisomerase n=1 Tax=Paenibacillus aestuarii TaxID=516965 RepID=A0ABW0K252_9BACL|nr:6-phospho-3-hexuloisomerase [Paenibacillus aestuarii]
MAVNVTHYNDEILKELVRSVNRIDEGQAEALVEGILRARRIFTAGAGRSGLILRAFAMRLMHMGLQASVVGEAVTPGIGKEDLLIIGSGSGETKSLVSMAVKATSIGASIALITTNPESAIGCSADLIVRIAAAAKEEADRASSTIQPMGSLYEQTALLLLDAVVLRLMDRLEIDATSMLGMHANLE